jgi:DNA modification methylase
MPVRGARKPVARKTARKVVCSVPRAVPPRCNQLDGKRWLQNSISVWSDVRKTAEEQRLGHPALFPQQLVSRVIETFVAGEGAVVLDPFAGSGSTIVTAAGMNSRGIGLEISPEYIATGRARLAALTTEAARQSIIHHASAFEVSQHVVPESVDFCLTSPPYWNILQQRRTADSKAVRHYGNHDGDLGTIESYEEYLERLVELFGAVYNVLKPGAYCVIVVMDLRKKNRFYPLHSDLAGRLTSVGFEWDDLIVWNRQSEYNNLRPLGYPAVFRVNKVHEYLLIMQKRR